MEFLTYSIYLASGGQDSSGVMPTYGEFVCNIIARLTYVLPETPQQYWLSTLAIEMGERVPFIGAGILYEAINQVKTVLVLVAGWKVFSTLPGRF